MDVLRGRLTVIAFSNESIMTATTTFMRRNCVRITKVTNTGIAMKSYAHLQSETVARSGHDNVSG